MPSPRFPIPQGTLDMLILQILSLEPAHGYGIAQRLEQISRSVVQVNQGSAYPALPRPQQKSLLCADRAAVVDAGTHCAGLRRRDGEPPGSPPTAHHRSDRVQVAG